MLGGHLADRHLDDRSLARPPRLRVIYCRRSSCNKSKPVAGVEEHPSEHFLAHSSEHPRNLRRDTYGTPSEYPSEQSRNHLGTPLGTFLGTPVRTLLGTLLGTPSELPSGNPSEHPQNIPRTFSQPPRNTSGNIPRNTRRNTSWHTAHRTERSISVLGRRLMER